jgi:outer membrane protein insertion porin family
MGSVYGIDIELNGVTSKIVDTSALRTAYGVGVSWRSPIGPIGFDYGIADRYQAYDQKRTFRLNLGVGRYSF